MQRRRRRQPPIYDTESSSTYTEKDDELLDKIRVFRQNMRKGTNEGQSEYAREYQRQMERIARGYQIHVVFDGWRRAFVYW